MSLHFPDAFCRCSSINEANTLGDIGAMGRLLADEVLNIVQEVGDVRRLSFVGHSMGGLIIRAALTCQDMQPLLPKLYTLVTLATPHCGYLFGPSVLLASGISLLQKWSYSHSLAQVSLRDHDDPRQCYLFQLAQRTELSHFRQVLLLSSPEDHYSPYHSARIEHHDLSDEPWDPIYEELVDHIWSSLAHVPVSRIDVAFPQSQHRVDSAIGRAAHISFLENEQFIWRFMALYRKYFM
jgi:pimeloyl-ACP methyl ester carboxylesterase